MMTGILFMTFKDRVREEQIHDAITNFYTENSTKIKGMTYQQYTDEETLKEIRAVVDQKLNELNEKSKAKNKIHKSQKTLAGSG